MDRNWKLIPLVLVAAAGCTSMPLTQQSAYQTPPPQQGMPPQAAPPSPIDSLTTSVQKIFEPEKPPPAVEFTCQFAQRLQQLPDPSHGGQMNLGIVGQVFLYSHVDNKLIPSVPTGDLWIYVTDDTGRGPGLPPAEPSLFHFDSVTLKKLVCKDDRYGKCIALFLPWPAGWKDVNRLKIQAKYEQAGRDPLYAVPRLLTLDFGGNMGASAGGSVAVANSYGAMPDTRMAMRQMQMQQNPAMPMGQQVVQTGAWTQPMPMQQTLPQMAPPGAWSMPGMQPQQGMQYQNVPGMQPQQGMQYQNVPIQTQQPMQYQNQPQNQVVPAGYWSAPQQPMASTPNMPMPSAAPPVDQRFVIPRN